VGFCSDWHRQEGYGVRVETWNVSAFLLPCLWPVYIKLVLISDITEVNYVEPVISFGKDLGKCTFRILA